MALRQAPRKTLALRVPDVYRRNWIARSHDPTALNRAFSRIVQHGVYGGCVSPEILGDPVRNPWPVGGGREGGDDQCSRQNCGVCRTLFISVPWHSNTEG